MKRALLLALLVILAGCGGSTTPTETANRATTANGTLTATETQTTTRTPSPTPTATPTATPTPEPIANPWRADVITVHIDRNADTRYSERELVREALTFWSKANTSYNLRFKITNDTYADIQISFVRDIEFCGYEPSDTAIGCADTLPASGVYDSTPTEVRIKSGYNRSSTLTVLKHELGHTLGYGHDDTETFQFMSANTSATPVGIPNATEVANPYPNDTISVWVGEVPNNYYSEYKRQIEQTFEYVNNGADGRVSSNITLVQTESRSDADIVITLDSKISSGSDGSVYGYNLDEDAALERYTNATIRLEDIDENRVGWHVGYWLLYALGVTSDEYPDPFDEPAEDPREDWWEHY